MRIERIEASKHKRGRVLVFLEDGTAVNAVNGEALKTYGSYAAAKAKGLFRSEGKEYVMKDGDIVNFLFNV